MIIADTTAPPIETRGKAASRTAVILGVISLILVGLILISQVILAINPYRSAADQVNFLLEASPDLETRLDYTDLTHDRLQGSIAPELAYNITTQLPSTAEDQLIEVLATYGVHSTDVRTFTSLLDNIAHETLALQTALLHEEQANSLKPMLYQIRQEPNSVNTIRLNQIYEVSPLVIENLNDLRRRLLSLSNNMRLLTDSSQLRTVTDAFSQAVKKGDPGLGDALAYYESYTAWRSLPDACASLEIQFSGTVTILDDIFTAVNAARLQDRRMGYSLWEPTALWVDSNLALMIITAFVFIAAASIAFLSRNPFPVQPSQSAAAGNANLVRPPASTMAPTQPRNFGLSLFQGKSVPAAPQAAGAPLKLNQSRSRKLVNPRFIVLGASGERETKHLSTEKAFRIGSDPRNPIHIETREGGYIEIWVRFARAGFFIEVMFSESPVTLNRQPFTGARALHNGDLIQVLETNLIYFEE